MNFGSVGLEYYLVEVKRLVCLEGRTHDGVWDGRWNFDRKPGVTGDDWPMRFETTAVSDFNLRVKRLERKETRY